MYQAYIEGKDLYAMIAQSAFDNEYWENLEFYPEGTEIELDGKKIICGNKTHLNKAGKERRSVGKVLLLASTYGMSGATAGARLKKTKEEGQALLDKFFGKYTKVKQAIDDSKQYLRQHEYVEDWAGRRRHLPIIGHNAFEFELKNKSFNPILVCQNRSNMEAALEARWTAICDNKLPIEVDAIAKSGHPYKKKIFLNMKTSNRDFATVAEIAKKEGIILKANTGRIHQAERQCFNARIQGGAASLTKLAMIKIETDPQMQAWDAHLIITVHDEVLVECPEQYADLVEERLPKLMVDAAKENGIDIPMRCDPYNVNHWYIDEFTVSIQDEFKKLEANGVSRDKALNKVIKNHPEVPEQSIINTITKGNEIVL